MSELRLLSRSWAVSLPVAALILLLLVLLLLLLIIWPCFEACFTNSTGKIIVPTCITLTSPVEFMDLESSEKKKIEKIERVI